MKKMVPSIILFLNLMKRTYFTCFLMCFLTIQKADAQCPQEDITLSTQQEIDNFALTYPGCTELSGNLTINSFPSDDIVDLNGLETITSITGDLTIEMNDALESLWGLNNLNFVGENLGIYNNDSKSLAGLQKINTIGGSLSIINNDSLFLLSGLTGLTSIGEDLTISANYRLISLLGLKSVTDIGGSIMIEDNPNLSFCSVFGICSYMNNGGLPDLQSNATGCNSPAEIQDACAVCPTGNVILTSQQEVNDFAVNYPNCTRINDNLFIEGPEYTVSSNISDLTPLSNLRVIGRSLDIFNNGALTTLTGLDNIDSVGFDVSLKNNYVLTSLSGLQNITTVPQELRIDNCDNLKTLSGLDGIEKVYNLFILYNNNLDSLNGLEQLVHVEREVWMFSNGLKSLTGLQNLKSARNVRLGFLPLLRDFRGLAGFLQVIFF